MGSDLYFDGKKFISSSRAAKISGYVNDYIGQLSRDGKLDCRMVGRSWYVSLESLLDHKKSNLSASKNRDKRESLIVDKSAIIREESTKDSHGSDTPFIGKEVPSVLESKAKVRVFASHHKLFEISFPKLVSAALSLILAITVFQLFLGVNDKAQVAYRIVGEQARKSIFVPAYTRGSIISASVLSVAGKPFENLALNFYLAVNNFLYETKSKILVMTGKEVAMKVPAVEVQEEVRRQSAEGMVVVPVDKKDNKDAVVAKIQSSFSDEVLIVPRGDGVSGVITPIFKKTSDDEYLYVLVPLRN